MLDDLGALASLSLAGSLAVERLVTIIKTYFPSLTEAVRARAGESEMRVDRERRLRVLTVTMLASVITAILVANGKPWYLGAIGIDATRSIPWPLFALLISGGSAFWTSIVAYASAAKDVQYQERARRERDLSTTIPRGTPAGDAPLLPPVAPSVVRGL